MANRITAFFIIIGMLIIFPQMSYSASLQEDMQKKYCTSSATEKCECLGYLEGYDDILRSAYAFTICKVSYLKAGDYEIVIRSNLVTGTSLTKEKARELAKTADKEYFTYGKPFDASDPAENRHIEYRFYQQNGEPTAIEIFLVTRDNQGNAKSPKTVKVPWPKE